MRRFIRDVVKIRFTRGMRRGMVHTVEIEKTEEQTHDHSSRR